MRIRVVRSRRLVGLLTVVALVAIFVGVTGFEIQLPRFGSAPERAPSPGVRAAAASTLLKVGAGAPPGGELAFLAVEPSGNLFVSDSKRHTVMRSDPSGHLLSEFGPTFGEATLAEPAGLAGSGDTSFKADSRAPRRTRTRATVAPVSRPYRP